MALGYQSLGVFDLTTSETIEGDWVEDLEDMTAALIGLRFIYGSTGSGSPAAKAYVQSSSDNGTTAHDIACVVFGVVSEHKLLNFSSLTPKTTQVEPTDGTLSDDTAVDGLIGDRLRVKLVVTGVYAGSTQLVASLVAR